MDIFGWIYSTALLTVIFGQFVAALLLLGGIIGAMIIRRPRQQQAHRA